MKRRLFCFQYGRRGTHSSLNDAKEHYHNHGHGHDHDHHHLIDMTEASAETKSLVAQQFRLYLNVISEAEEAALVTLFDRKFRGRPYENSHFDHVISGYRELSYTLPSAPSTPTDPSTSLLCSLVNDRLLALIQNDMPALQPQHMLPLHILDLAQDGYIDPHVDHAEASVDKRHQQHLHMAFV